MGVSTFNGINIALRGLIAQQRALDVDDAQHRERQHRGLHAPGGRARGGRPDRERLGVGHALPRPARPGRDGRLYRRIRDVFNDVQLRAATSEQSSLDVRYRELHAISLAIPEPSDNGMQSLVQDFFNAWHDVCNAPGVARRAPVARAGRAVADPALNHASTTFSTMRANDNTEINADIGDANSILTQIASLNTQIGQLVLAGAQLDPATLQVVKPGQAPNDLLDRRDLLLDQLGKLANVSSVTYDDQNRATVVVAGLTVVTPTAGATAITRAQMDAQFASGALTGGALHALEDAYTNLLNEATATSYPSQLNALAQALHDAVNAQHALGADLSGTAGGMFFDFTSASRASRRGRPDHDVVGDPRQPDHDRRRRHRRRAPARPPTRTRWSRCRTRSRPAARRSSTTTTGSSPGSARPRRAPPARSTRSRSSSAACRTGGYAASGVSLDEEMTNMIKFQHAYAAASRVLSAMDENLDRLINSTGRVGL